MTTALKLGGSIQGRTFVRDFHNRGSTHLRDGLKTYRVPVLLSCLSCPAGAPSRRTSRDGSNALVSYRCDRGSSCYKIVFSARLCNIDFTKDVFIATLSQCLAL